MLRNWFTRLFWKITYVNSDENQSVCRVMKIIMYKLHPTVFTVFSLLIALFHVIWRRVHYR